MGKKSHNKKVVKQGNDVTNSLDETSLSSQQHPPCSGIEQLLEETKSPLTPVKHECYGTDSDLSDNYSRVEWWIILGIVVIVSFATRLYKIEWPAHVCWDETHFGKMGSWYINGTFFFDVHPPLGKMLIGLTGWLSGYNGNFTFSKPGVQYDDVPYVGMRAFCASLGATLAPLAYGTVWELTHSITASMLTGALFIFDTGLLTLCQYILLDSPLLFFIMAATYCLTKFANQSFRPFKFAWWAWMVLTGFFLACAMGVKFVGLFVILLTGWTTINDLWRILGDLTTSMCGVLVHLLARSVCLILLPLGVYLSFYAVHFDVLTKSGSGDGFFSSAFQSQLEGNALFNANMPAEVAYGSVITLKNYRTGGGYLHSHLHLYPENVGARQQQVTAYGHKDDNNKWIFKKMDTPENKSEEPELVMNGDMVRVEHISTKRNLHTHEQPAPMTPRHQQVTCYGNDGEGDYNDVFRIEFGNTQKLNPLLTVRTTFRLVHKVTGCALQSHSKQLPKWAWEQMEVTCNPMTRDKKSLWNVEEVIDARLPNRSFTVFGPSFLTKVVESHAVMMQGNSGLKPKVGEVTSKPWQWPINYKGQAFSGGDERVYLLGNPVLWWSNLAAGGIFLLIAIVHTVRKQRNQNKVSSKDGDKCGTDVYISAGGWLVRGWLLHYAPFWTMGRVLYFHHYFPCLLYSFMLTGVTLDFLVSCISRAAGSYLEWTVRHVLLGSLLSSFVYSFYLFSPLSYGMSGPLANEPTSRMYGLKWLDSWDI